MRHYAVENDLIGGWDISWWNVPVSQHNPDAGMYTIGSFLSKEWAERIAAALDDDGVEWVCKHPGLPQGIPGLGRLAVHPCSPKLDPDKDLIHSHHL